MNPYVPSSSFNKYLYFTISFYLSPLLLFPGIFLKISDIMPQIILQIHNSVPCLWGFHGKESTFHAGDVGSILGSGRLPGEGNGSPLLYSCWKNPIYRVAWQSAVMGSQKSQTQLGNYTTATANLSLINNELKKYHAIFMNLTKSVIYFI